MPEKKPFDVADLSARLKAKGIPLAEDALQIMTAEVFAWGAEGCALKGGLFALAAPGVAMVGEALVKLEDKIDGVDGK